MYMFPMLSLRFTSETEKGQLRIGQLNYHDNNFVNMALRSTYLYTRFTSSLEHAQILIRRIVIAK